MNHAQLLDAVGPAAQGGAAACTGLAGLYVGDWMTAPAKALHRNIPIIDAYNMAVHWDIRHFPVLDADRLAGIVSLGDLREALPAPGMCMALEEMDALLVRTTVGQVMTPRPFTVTSETPIRDAAALMLERKVGSLPVVDSAGELVGILTESDLFRLLIAHWDGLVTAVAAAATVPSSPRRSGASSR